jgi:hypothetical protein
MLLAVSGIVHATPSRRTVRDVMSEPVATRRFTRSPLAESQGGAGFVPAVATASAIVVRTSTAVIAMYPRRPAPVPGNPGRRMPIATLPSAHTTSTPPATKNGTFERSTTAITRTVIESRPPPPRGALKVGRTCVESRPARGLDPDARVPKP